MILFLRYFLDEELSIVNDFLLQIAQITQPFLDLMADDLLDLKQSFLFLLECSVVIILHYSLR